MRRPEVCKHQVCDHCGGRFGMVTHRWWGNKFCKRACKNAHRRENHHTQSGWVIPRFFTFAGGACLAAAVAVVMLTLLLASANAAPGEERPVTGSSLELNKEDGTLYIDWSGPINAAILILSVHFPLRPPQFSCLKAGHGQDRYAHGGTQLAVGHHGDELMP